MQMVYQRLRRDETRPIRDGMGRLENSGRSALGDRPMPGNNEAFEGMRPRPLERGSHLARCFAGPDNDCPSLRRIRQMADQRLVRVRRPDCLVK